MCQQGAAALDSPVAPGRLGDKAHIRDGSLKSLVVSGPSPFFAHMRYCQTDCEVLVNVGICARLRLALGRPPTCRRGEITTMKLRGLLTAGAAAGLLAAAFAVPGLATGASASPSPAGSVASQPLSTTVFAAAARGVAGGKPAGVIPTRDSVLAARAARVAAAPAAPAACAEPNCNLPYHGGKVQHAPRVYLVFWGPKWADKNNTLHKNARNYLINFYKGLGASKDGWSTVMSQYNDKTGHPVFGRSLLAGWKVDTKHKVPANVSGTDLVNEAGNGATMFGIKLSQAENVEIVIASQARTCFAPIGGLVFGGNCGSPISASTPGYCAFHSFDVANANHSIFLPWVNLPFQPDAGTACGKNFVNASGAFDGFSMSGGHETAETITDPAPNSGYIDLSDTTSGGEIADKCAWGGKIWGSNDPFGDLHLSTGSFAMQSLWSNVTRNCVMTGALPLTVNAISDQVSITGTAVSLKVSATITPAVTLHYAASGLPGGVHINQSGQLFGTPNVSAGIYHTKISVSYYAGSKTIAFTWRVHSPTGAMKGLASKCVSDSGGRTTDNNPIVIHSCDGGTEQQITFMADGNLIVLGKCITGTGSVFLHACAAGAKSQIWTRFANGEYQLAANSKCLTASSSTNGTKLTTTTCRNTANQHWSLP